MALDNKNYPVYTQYDMRNKAVKSFTVDEQVYIWLVEKLKEADIGIGVSSLLDGYLKYLYQGLREIFNYMEKKKINLPASFVVSRYIEEQAFFHKYDWGAIEKVDKHGDFRKEMDKEVASYVTDLLAEFKEKHKGRWQKKSIDVEISKIDRSDG
ncbi:MAG: hypothetical protein WC855_12540 [Thermodesulfovibrionales bacterium]